MKKVVLILPAILLFFSIGYGQTRNGLKGPAAKNYKPWKDKNKSHATLVTFDKSDKKLMGPEAKNHKPWENKEKFQSVTLVSTANDKKKLMGPEAKNHKVWQN
ncbi:hypothetical protein [Reichenbachiella sp. MALMAid0571]|uniref:hypothetical protein n=1 Tax=Reichenbachiella sp. MALMAid0571 TaxID=3143939 RepID=UPI0032E00016